jgi:glycosyltransferase involved in cell wall biosynthesis
MNYALITPARDEAGNLERLAGCVLEQTVRPQVWIIVDNGSRDGTAEIGRGLAGGHDWIELMTTEGAAKAEPGPPVVRAFQAGLARLNGAVDVVIKLDADVSIEPGYFEELLAAFADDPALGIASGVCYEERNGEWRQTYVTEAHVRGASRAYRWSCLQDVLPLVERVGWDGIDELKANTRGWDTRTVDGLSFHHHRRVGERDEGATTRWARQGRAAHFMGYRWSYLVLRTVHHARRDLAAVAMLWGFVAAKLAREPRYYDGEVRRHLRERQRLRRLPLRMREALGRRT